MIKKIAKAAKKKFSVKQSFPEYVKFIDDRIEEFKEAMESSGPEALSAEEIAEHADDMTKEELEKEIDRLCQQQLVNQRKRIARRIKGI